MITNMCLMLIRMRVSLLIFIIILKYVSFIIGRAICEHMTSFWLLFWATSRGFWLAIAIKKIQFFRFVSQLHELMKRDCVGLLSICWRGWLWETWSSCGKSHKLCNILKALAKVSALLLRSISGASNNSKQKQEQQSKHLTLLPEKFRVQKRNSFIFLKRKSMREPQKAAHVASLPIYKYTYFPICICVCLCFCCYCCFCCWLLLLLLVAVAVYAQQLYRGNISSFSGTNSNSNLKVEDGSQLAKLFNHKNMSSILIICI